MFVFKVFIENVCRSIELRETRLGSYELIAVKRKNDHG